LLYNIIDLEQNSEPWHRFRQTHIGASDAAIIMGKSKWKDEYTLYLEKCGFQTPPPMNQYMQRCHDLEQAARDVANHVLKQDFVPMVLESAEFPFLSCSLDGFNAQRDVILEIKCNGGINHRSALEGVIPIYYVIQMQHQLMISGARYCTYFSYNPEHKTPWAIINLQPLEEMQREILAKEQTFWHHILHLDHPGSEMDILKKTYQEIENLRKNL
jgi:putative phage-type endonuclease